MKKIKEIYRFPITVAAIGMNESIKVAENKRIFPTYIAKVNKKILIIDSNNEYEEYEAINPTEAKNFGSTKKAEIKRVTFSSTIKKEEEMKTVFRYFENGLLVISDIINFSREIISIMSTMRSREVDIIYHAKSVDDINFKILQNTNVIQQYKTEYPINKERNEFLYEPLTIMRYLIRDKNEELEKDDFYCSYNILNGYILGDFTKEELEKSCRKFLEMHIYEYPYRNKIRKMSDLDKYAKELVNKYIIKI
ncbi:MAG: hypothetical protein PHT69_02460 [Bacteroidales bacterium]|nr:hypothetical protein [Bacteroidales bacterium]